MLNTLLKGATSLSAQKSKAQYPTTSPDKKRQRSDRLEKEEEEEECLN